MSVQKHLDSKTLHDMFQHHCVHCAGTRSVVGSGSLTESGTRVPGRSDYTSIPVLLAVYSRLVPGSLEAALYLLPRHSESSLSSPNDLLMLLP